jgi:AP-1 complex subunit mu
MRQLPNDNTLIWTIKQFPSSKQFSLRTHFGLPAMESEDEEGRRSLLVSFEIPSFTVSGLRLEYLKVYEK